MSARAIVSGAMHKAAEERISKAEKRFATFKLRENVNGSTRWWSVIAFDEAAIAAVLVVKDGEPVAISGEITAELWTPEAGGQPRLSWKIIADAVLTARRQRRGRDDA
jgi:single-stranded DNA-binding protein